MSSRLERLTNDIVRKGLSVAPFLDERLREAKDPYARAQAIGEAVQQVRDVRRTYTGGIINVKISRTKHHFTMRSNMDLVAEAFPSRWIERSNKHPRRTLELRGWYWFNKRFSTTSYSHHGPKGRGVITIRPWALNRPGAYAHEFWHSIQAIDVVLGEIENCFRVLREAADRPMFWDYAHKGVGNGWSEVGPCGIGAMIDSPFGDPEGYPDPEHRALVIGLLAFL